MKKIEKKGNLKITKETQKTDWKEERVLYLLLAIVGAIIMVFSYFRYENTTGINEVELITVDNIVLSQNPEVVRGKYGERVLLHVKNNNKPFQVSGDEFSEMIKQDIIEYIKASDTISVKTDKSEFNKIGNETFFDNYTEINSLTKNGQQFLDIELTNIIKKKKNQLEILIGLYFLVISLIYWSFKTRPRFSPTIVICGGFFLLLFIFP